MHFPRIISLLPNLSLPHPMQAEIIAEASAHALNPQKTLLDCPYNLHTPDDWFTREQRTLWRVSVRAFRKEL
jgi:hypothetical protein